MSRAFRLAAARPRGSVVVTGFLLVALLAPFAARSADGVEPAPAIKTESFDRDPGWEGHHNRVVPESVPVVKQDFGYRATNLAGKDKGEIGGTIWRTSTPASYAAKIAPRTLDEPFSAAGTFALTATRGSSGAFFGWFNSELTGGGRQSTLGFRFAGEGEGARLTLQLVTATNQACGTKVTPWVKGRDVVRHTPPAIRNDGTRYAWTLAYDPQANGGGGQIRFTIRGNSPEPAEFEGKEFVVDLPEGYKRHDTTFDRLGLTNSMRGGNPLTVHFDDLEFDGRTEDFAADPGWIGSGNQAEFEDRERGGAHDFGFAERSNAAGGNAAGEVGGILWRSGEYGYYADRVGPLTLDDRLEASGKVVLAVGAPDSGMYFGWFSGAEQENAPTQVGNFVGVKVGGPTRAGHYFLPAYATAKTTPIERVGKDNRPAKVAVELRTGPALIPQRVFDWKLLYDPAGNGGAGTIEATLGTESVTLPLKPGHRAKGATLDRFGLFTGHLGGSFVKIYLDDLKYTARPALPSDVPGP
jgi:hypothetical protein